MDTVPTSVEFKRRFPEFNTAPADLVSQCLLDASTRTRQWSYPRYENAVQACMLKAAVLLLQSPYGQKMRLEAPEQAFAYEYELGRLQRSSVMGKRVF